MQMNITVGAADADLDQALSDGLDAFNAAATAQVSPQQELTIAMRDGAGLVGGASGWTWGTCAGVSMVWLREDSRRGGLGGRLLAAFEEAALARGARQVLVSSFTFQAPEFYRKRGYVEFARSKGLPVEGSADVHFCKDL